MVIPDRAIAFNCNLPRKHAGLDRLLDESPRVLEELAVVKAKMIKAKWPKKFNIVETTESFGGF